VSGGPVTRRAGRRCIVALALAFGAVGQGRAEGIRIDQTTIPAVIAGAASPVDLEAIIARPVDRKDALGSRR
jgi:hypothetical protein